MWRPACGFANRKSGGRTRGSQLGSVAGNREAGPRPWGVSPPSRAARRSLNRESRRSACWRESDGQKTPRRVPVKRPHFFRGVTARREPGARQPLASQEAGSAARRDREAGNAINPERKPLAGRIVRVKFLHKNNALGPHCDPRPPMPHAPAKLPNGQSRPCATGQSGHILAAMQKMAGNQRRGRASKGAGV
jgi:hypothetical protein